MFLLKWLSKLPLSALYVLGDILFFFAYSVFRYRRKVVYDNLKNSFPSKNEAEVKSIARKHYQRFAEYVVESLKSISISEKEIKERVTFKNTELIQSYADRGQSLLFLGSHQFNWEWAFLAASLQLPMEVSAVYKKLSNKSFDQLMFDIRSKFGGTPIESKKLLRTIISTRDKKRIVAMMADQSPQRSSPKHWTTFMNQDTAFFLGPVQMAYATKYAVVYFSAHRIKRGYYEVTYIPVADPPYEKNDFSMLDTYANELEKMIQADPPGYMWTHRRWKLKKED